ncbi:MAG: gluconokinase [Pseudonocardiales bacterium]|nr:gluconokinase [Pseudonocardiales bacterium]
MKSPTVPIVVMGVTGCGKTTLGTLLAQRLGMPYLEADDFHPAANKAKMQAKTPLTDEDRQPWLSAIAKRMAASISPPPPVVSCSALKRQYRDLLRQADPRIWFLHLAIDETTATQRVKARPGHFMPASLVASQFATLEPLHAESGLAVDATRPPQDIIATAVHQLIAQGLLTAPRSEPSFKCDLCRPTAVSRKTIDHINQGPSMA